MRLLSVLEPSVLHVTAEDWHDEELVARFEQRWMDLIDALTETGDAGLEHTAVHSSTIEALIWDTATGPAWVTERNAKQRLLAIFAQRLRPLMDSVDAPLVRDAYTVPPLDDRPNGDPWLVATLDLLAWAVDEPADVAVQLGVNGTDADTTELVAKGGEPKSVDMCHTYAELLCVLPLKELAAASDASRLPRVVDLAIRRFVANNPERTQVYELHYSDTFCKQFAEATSRLKPHVVDTIVSRVTQTQKTSQADKGLKDEPLKDGGNRRRCRVTRDWRIHYSYDGPESILLETVGTHDLGL